MASHRDSAFASCPTPPRPALLIKSLIQTASHVHRKLRGVYMDGQDDIPLHSRMANKDLS